MISLSKATHLVLMATALASASSPALARTNHSAAAHAAAPAEEFIRIRSANSFDETVVRLVADVQAKGIRLFDRIDQSALGAAANLKIGRSTLVIFGNPPLGVQFLQSNPYAGIDWPVRMLVVEEADGSVWVAWTDFNAIARRYRIADKPDQLKMAGEVAASIATAATSR